MSTIDVTDWTLPGSDGQTIFGNTHWPTGQAAGVLVCCHGFKGYKDYGFLPLLCDHAARRGLIALRFNFSHSGMTNNIDTFERPDLFEKDRWGRQIEDLGAVLDEVAAHEDTAGLPRCVFGHSRGGVTSTLYAGRTASAGLAGLITAASPDDACDVDDLVKEQFRAEGRLLSPSGRTGQALYVGLDWLEEVQRDPDFYNPRLAAAHVDCPMLILHGDADETIPLDCGHRLHDAAGTPSELAVIEDANHVFNSPNPLAIDTPIEQLPIQTRALIERSVAFALACCG